MGSLNPFRRNRKTPEPAAEETNETVPRVPAKAAPELSREELLDQFLSRITPRNEAVSEVKTGELGRIELSDYPAVAVPTRLESKLLELKAISDSIDKQMTLAEQLTMPDFSSYRVNYPQVLNPAQLAGVLTTDRPVLCIAGAGSGKTRVIVHRVSFLIEKGVNPSSILLLTFTRKAAAEMLMRVETLLHDKNVGRVTGGTFHSFASYVLRKYANMLGLPVNFTIIDTADSEDVIDLIRTELKYNTREKKFPKKERLFDIISYARNRQSTIREIILSQYSGLEDRIADIEMIGMAYEKYKKNSRILDFDDLLEVLNNALKTHARFRDIMQETYQYVMVDEFQDTNAVQYEIVRQVAARHRRLMVVGDDAQSIYAFRGADYENILRFPAHYPDCVVVKIEENYRSNQHILNFTNSIIGHARIGYRKRLYTRHQTSRLPVVHRAYDQESEAGFVVDRIMEMREQGIPLNQIAVLNRADWHNRYIQAELSRRGIPYVVVGGFKFNERMHIRDVVAFLRLTYNPSDAVSWHRVLKYIGGIGQVTAVSVVTTLQQGDNPYDFEAFRRKNFYNDLYEMGLMLSEASLPEHSLTRKIEIIRDYYAPLLKAREDDYAARMQDVDVLADLSKKYDSLDKFLSDFALDPPSKRVADQSIPLIDEGEEQGKITVSTVHSAKGLEWYAVFIPHALDGLFPSNRATDLEEMEEERRLFYVACSRAREELFITLPRNISSYDAFFHMPSRFLVEIGKELYVTDNS